MSSYASLTEMYHNGYFSGVVHGKMSPREFVDVLAAVYGVVYTPKDSVVSVCDRIVAAVSRSNLTR
jgi:hypothetical protein